MEQPHRTPLPDQTARRLDRPTRHDVGDGRTGTVCLRGNQADTGTPMQHILHIKCALVRHGDLDLGRGSEYG
jgi:hypothetical protein